MAGIDLLVTGTLLVLAANNPQPARQPANLCPFVKTAEISVVPSTKDIRYDSSKSLAQMQSTEIDTINPYSFSGVTVTQAYMEGTVGMKAEIKLGSQYDRRTGGVCIWYDKISVPMVIDPTIHIAKEVYADPCLREETIEHEMKHVNVDRRVVNKYAKILGREIYAALEERGFRAQPVAPENAQAMADRMQTVIRQIIEFEYKKMDIERIEEQRKVDTLAEYERLSKLCPESQKKMPGWASSVKSSGKNRQKKSSTYYRP